MFYKRRKKIFYTEKSHSLFHFLFLPQGNLCCLLIGQAGTFWPKGGENQQNIGAPNAGYIAAWNQHLSGFRRVLTQSSRLEYYIKLYTALPKPLSIIFDTTILIWLIYRSHFFTQWFSDVFARTPFNQFCILLSYLRIY